MDENKVEKALSELSPRTQYAAFLIIWPSIEDAIRRKISKSEIWKTCATGGLDVSYVTFTRMVKKKLTEDEVGPVVKSKGSSPALPQKMEAIAVNSVATDMADKSAKVATTSGMALEEVRTSNKNKDYSKVARQHNK